MRRREARRKKEGIEKKGKKGKIHGEKDEQGGNKEERK